MAEGTIKKLTDKGFGFIKTGGARRTCFFIHLASKAPASTSFKKGSV